jgi:uncharacterized protein with ParB-like and HNH nuclease domain
MATNIDVNKQNVVDLLKSGKEHLFVIPEYQRPYAWSDDEVITLFDDLWNFSIERSQPGGPKTYFLGSIVSFENEKGEKEIIDGQQRITSLFLLLRAIFYKLEAMDSQSDETQNFISLITPALWVKNEITGKVDRTQILLRSDVATDHGNEILRKILETGKADKEAKDNYSRNFNKFLELYEEKSKDNPMLIYHFINALLNYSILLPISADSQDTALTIFSTLNNRGLPLSDADIFKSLLYKQLDSQGKKVFANKWKVLEADADTYGETIQSLFYYRMFHMRAENKEDNTTVPGVRKYFTEKGKDRLKVELVDTLKEDLNLWKVVNMHEELEDEPWSKNVEILKALDILANYNNEYWKYPTLIFYNTHKRKENFEKLFLKFLHKLIVLLVTRYLEKPTISAVKTDIFKLNVQIIGSAEPEFTAGFKVDLPTDGPNPYFVTPSRNMVRMLLMMLAYDSPRQVGLLPDKWEIEHIFPQKWDNSFYKFDFEETNSKLEHIGNKLPLEKPKNIKASNGYFEKKKVQYKDSKIAIVQELGECTRDTWLPDDIIRRDAAVSNQLTALIDKWVKEYTVETVGSRPQPTPEQAEWIRKLREDGFMIS